MSDRESSHTFDNEDTILVNGWKRLHVRDFAIEVKRAERVRTDKSYRLLGMRWYARGPFVKSVTRGSEIRSKTVNRVCDGDFIYNRLFAWKGSFGVALKEHDGAHVSGEFPTMVLRDDIMNPHFLWRYFSQPGIWSHIESQSTGSARVSRFRFKQEQLLQMEVVVPPVEEQLRVVSVLSAVQRAKEKTEATISALKELKKSMIKHLFTYGPVPLSEIDQVDLKQTEIGEMAEKWLASTLGEHVRGLAYGFTASSTDRQTGLKFLRITDITDEGVGWDTVPYCECSESLRGKYLLQKGDILVARIGATTGKSYLVDVCPSAVFASYLIRVRTTPTILPEFLHLFMQTPQYWKQVSANKGGRLKGGVNLPVLRKLVIPVPDLAQQAKIVEMMMSIDVKILRERNGLSAIEPTFHTLLDNLMTGRLRVNNLEVPT